METKKLAKIIKLVVEQELNRRLPKLVDERVKQRLMELKHSDQQPIVEDIEQDPFSLANNLLDEFQTNSEPIRTTKKNTSRPVKQLSKNPILNEILNNTTPFKDRGAPPAYGDEPLMENMDRTLNFDSNMAPAGMDGIRAKMQSNMGLTPQSKPNSGGMGVTTGLPALDRILNRDNSELVKKFRTRK